MKKILGMGNALTDIIYQLENDKALTDFSLAKGSMTLIDATAATNIKSHFIDISPKMVTGGSASNTINGISKLGLTGGFIGKTGDDTIGHFFAKESKENGVTPHLKHSLTPSGHCTVLVSKDGERTMCTYLGAAAELLANELDKSVFTDYDFFHIEGYLVQNYKLIETALKMAKDAGLTTSIDMASFNIVEEHNVFLHHIIANYVDIVFANEEEAKAFTGKAPYEALQELGKICRIAIVKIGEEGSYIKANDKTLKIAPVKAISVDTTGAGDMYAAGMIYGLAKDYPLELCGKIASYLSSKIVEVVGAKLSDKTWKEIYLHLDSLMEATA